MDEPEPMVVGKLEPEIMQSKVVSDLAYVDANQIPDSPSHLFLGNNASKPVSSSESISFRQSGNASSAFSVISQHGDTSSQFQRASGPLTAVPIFHDDDPDRVTVAKFGKDSSMAASSLHLDHVSNAYYCLLIIHCILRSKICLCFTFVKTYLL